MAGASGYAGGELLRLLLGHPEVEIGALTGAQQRRRAARRAPAAPGAAGRPGPRGDQRRDPRRPRRRLPGPAARPVRPRSRPSWGSEVVVIDCGADFRLADAGGLGAVLRRRPRRHLALRPARAARPARRCWPAPRGSPCPAATRPSPRWPWRPAVAAGLVEPRRRRGRRLRHQRRRQGRQAAPARQRGDGQRLGVRRRRRPPAHPRDHPEPLRPRPTAPVTRQLHADAGADAARHPRHLLGAAAPTASPPTTCARPTRRRTPTSRSCTCSPRASGRRPSR